MSPEASALPELKRCIEANVDARTGARAFLERGGRPETVAEYCLSAPPPAEAEALLRILTPSPSVYRVLLQIARESERVSLRLSAVEQLRREHFRSAGFHRDLTRVLCIWLTGQDAELRREAFRLTRGRLAKHKHLRQSPELREAIAKLLESDDVPYPQRYAAVRIAQFLRPFPTDAVLTFLTDAKRIHFESILRAVWRLARPSESETVARAAASLDEPRARRVMAAAAALNARRRRTDPPPPPSENRRQGEKSAET